MGEVASIVFHISSFFQTDYQQSTMGADPVVSEVFKDWKKMCEIQKIFVTYLT